MVKQYRCNVISCGKLEFSDNRKLEFLNKTLSVSYSISISQLNFKESALKQFDWNIFILKQDSLVVITTSEGDLNRKFLSLASQISFPNNHSAKGCT